MPSVTWNKERWGPDLERFRKRGVARYWGERWGDPEMTGLRYLVRKLRYGDRVAGNLGKVRKRYLERFVTPESVVVEIGAGGGRWTQYLLRAREVIVVELDNQFFPYLEERFPDAAAGGKLRFYETSGYEMSGIDDESVDFVFSFGTFVHIDPEGIDAYLGEIRRVLRPDGTASIHYADRSKKWFAGRPPGFAGFSKMNAEKMEELITRHGVELVEHDQKTLVHSNVAVLRRPA